MLDKLKLLSKVNLIPKRYKIAICIALFVAYSLWLINMGKSIADGKCASDKLAVATEVIENVEEAIIEHDEDQKAIKEFKGEINEVVNNAKNNIANAPPVDLSADCASGSLLRLQREVFAAFPSEVFVQ